MPARLPSGPPAVSDSSTFSIDSAMCQDYTERVLSALLRMIGIIRINLANFFLAVHIIARKRILLRNR